jgi:hypothetical protein
MHLQIAKKYYSDHHLALPLQSHWLFLPMPHLRQNYQILCHDIGTAALRGRWRSFGGKSRSFGEKMLTFLNVLAQITKLPYSLDPTPWFWLAVSSQCRSLKVVEGHLEEKVGHLEEEGSLLFTFLNVTSNCAHSTKQQYFSCPHPLILIGYFFQI